MLLSIFVTGKIKRFLHSDPRTEAMAQNFEDDSQLPEKHNIKTDKTTEDSETTLFPEGMKAGSFIALQRYHLLGTLATGVMHDFNNALMTLLVSVGLIPKLAPLNPEQQKLVEKIHDVILKASKSTSLLLEFARQPQPELIVFEVNFLVKEAFALVRDRLPVTVTPILELTPEKLSCRGDVRQLFQALVNGMFNAVEAVGAGGYLQVRTERAQPENLTEKPLTETALASAFVQITINDSGPGLSPDLEDPFQPLASTKETGRGLGLAAAQSIIQQHGGSINLTYQAPRGSHLTILLPLVDPS